MYIDALGDGMLIQTAFVGLLRHFKQCMLMLPGGEQFVLIQTAFVSLFGQPTCAHRVRDDDLVSRASCM